MGWANPSAAVAPASPPQPAQAETDDGFMRQAGRNSR